jgi:hypothetical protein
MKIDVRCEECGGYMEIIKEWTDRSGLNITVGPCERSIEAQAAADRRLEMLEEALRAIESDWTDDNPLGYERYVNTKLAKKIRKELSDGSN